MTVLTAVLAVLCAGLYALHTVLSHLSVKWAKDRDAREVSERLERRLEERRIKVEERKIALQEMVAEKPKAIPPMPEDLKNRYLAWEDPWAQEDEKRTLYSLYDEFGDWDVVRTKLVPLNIAMDVDGIATPREGMIQ